jgi:hypothetical protein
VPARPSLKGRFGEGKAFGIGEGKMESGARREVEQGLTAFVHNLASGGALGEILILIWGATLGRNFDVIIGRAA